MSEAVTIAGFLRQEAQAWMTLALELKRQAAENEAAIRAAMNALYVVHMHHATCGACIAPYIDLKDEHAAALARAEQVGGEKKNEKEN